MGLMYTIHLSGHTMDALLARKPEKSAQVSSSRFIISTVRPGEPNTWPSAMHAAPGGAGPQVVRAGAARRMIICGLAWLLPATAAGG